MINIINMISDLKFVLGYEAKFLLRILYLNISSLGAFFEALKQHTDGCKNLLWLQVSHWQNILLAQNNRDSTFKVSNYTILCKLELHDPYKAIQSGCV